jgi:uncharacterized sulfatase
MPDRSTQPDVVLLVLDTQRADRLSCYGYERDTTPHIDQFAETGALFERAIVPGQWTIPSHASIFTGEYPTTHMINQIYNKLGTDYVTLAELLKESGYKTVGFCNNPLLGVVENELDRGFDEFYNYGGTVPNVPEISHARPKVGGRLAESSMRVLRRITRTIENRFAHDNRLLRLAMIPFLANLWLRYSNFKGNTLHSLRDTLGFMRTHHRLESPRQPLFVFINLMEVHLPYLPPKRFVRRFAPGYLNNREARNFMNFYNSQSYQWMVPITEPFTEIQDQTLNNLYDAETAYQDHLLRHLFRYLDNPGIRENTMVIVTSDHGEGLNHHDFMGHSLVAYDDLVKIPLIIRYPDVYPAGVRNSTPVSNRRIFHSVLEAAGISMDAEEVESSRQRALADVHRLSLARTLESSDPEGGAPFAEAYVPDTLISLMNTLNPQAIDTFRCKSMRRAAYRDRLKLIMVGDEVDELFDVIADPSELDNLLSSQPEAVAELEQALSDFVVWAEGRRPANWEASGQVDLQDEAIADRLRSLGYLE